MVIRNYHWLNLASRVLISICSAPLVQTAERKQFSLFDLDLWPTTLTYNPRLAKIKVDPHAKNQGQRSNGSNRRAPTDKRTDRHTDAANSIIAPATRSIKTMHNIRSVIFVNRRWVTFMRTITFVIANSHRPTQRTSTVKLCRVGRCELPIKHLSRGTVVERRSLAGELPLSCARPAADGDHHCG